MMDERIRKLFAEVLSPAVAAALNADSSMETVEGWDSQTFVSLIVAIETEFGVILSGLDAARMNSLRAIVDVLGEKGVRLAS
jgi:acyl carrier protein